ncbi:MAG: aldose 1-epimerase [Thermoanaerobaculia bacterium]|nr:aldose 1-epimerase [Thermoanaerobaculia bacterium]
MIELQNDVYRLVIEPAIGASVRRLDVKAGGDWRPLWYPASDMLSDLGDVACYVLAPYSNRIRDGRFTYGGQSYELCHAELHAIHGTVRNRACRVVEQTKTTCKLRIVSSASADIDFPFPFVVDIEYRIRGDRFGIELALRNTGSSAMPAGAGFHPYFARTLVDPDERCTLSFISTGVYPTEDLPIPTGAAQPVPAELDFAEAREIDMHLDHCFAGWDGRATISWPGSNVTATIEASSSCGHIVAYSPLGEPFFAFEPVTHASDAVNLATRGIAGHGLVDLAPGQQLDLAMTIDIG